MRIIWGKLGRKHAEETGGHPQRISPAACFGKSLPKPVCGLMKFKSDDGKWSKRYPVLAGDIQGVRCVCVIPAYSCPSEPPRIPYEGEEQRYIFITDGKSKFLVSIPCNASFASAQYVFIGGSHPAIAGFVQMSGEKLGLTAGRFPEPFKPQTISPIKVSGGSIIFNLDKKTISADGQSDAYGRGNNALVSRLLTELYSALESQVQKALEFLGRLENTGS